MTTGPKISVIGAGSGEFSLGIVRDLCVMDHIQRMERNVQTFQSKDRGMLLDMLLIHPDARSPQDAKACLEELLALPFNADMAEWYQ